MGMDEEADAQRWRHLYHLIMRNSTLASKNFVPGQQVESLRPLLIDPVKLASDRIALVQTAQMIHDLIRVLVVGAGGLGTCTSATDAALRAATVTKCRLMQTTPQDASC